MKKYLAYLAVLLLALLLFGCSSASRTKEAVQKAQQNLSKADSLQGEINGNFYKIDIYSHDNDRVQKITGLTKEICVDCIKQQKTINQAIANMEQAKESTDDYQLKTFYDMRVNALQVKIDMAENGFLYADRIQKEKDDVAKVNDLLSLYNKTKEKQQDNFDDLMNEADRYMELKQG